MIIVRGNLLISIKLLSNLKFRRDWIAMYPIINGDNAINIFC